MVDTKDPWHYPRPELASELLDSLGRGLTSARGLFAARRMGKTEFLLQDLIPAARKAGVLTAYANLWDNRPDPATALVSAIAQAIKPGLLQKVWRDLQRPVKTVKATGKVKGIGEGSLEASLADAPDESEAALQRVLKELDRSGKNMLLVVDEAQVLALPQHADFAHALRAALDTRKQFVKVVFAGSSEATLRQMFARRSEPFFNWAPLEPFELLGPPFVAAMVDKVNAITKLPLPAADAQAAFDALGGTPEFFRRYLERYLAYPTQGSETALRYTQEHVYNSADFLSLWLMLSPSERQILQLIVENVDDLHSLDSRRRLGQALGRNGEVSLSLPQHALKRLQERGVLVRVAQGEYRFEDDAFSSWVKQRAASGQVSGAPKAS